MAQTSMTYGQLPSREAFDAAFDRECPGGAYRITNCKRVGNATFTASELWSELNDAVNESNAETCEGEWADDSRSYDEIQADEEAAGDWASCVLGTLGFEWI